MRMIIYDENFSFHFWDVLSASVITNQEPRLIVFKKQREEKEASLINVNRIRC